MFYHDYVLKDDNNCIILYFRSNIGESLGSKNSKSSSGFYEIARCPIESDFELSTSVQYTNDGDLFTNFFKGIAEGINDVNQIVRSVQNMLSKINSNIADAASQIKLITPDDYFLKFESANISPNLPSLNFVFPCTTFDGKLMRKKVLNLLYHITPLVASGKTFLDSPTTATNIRSIIPPMDYRNSFKGFDTSMIRNFFTIKMLGKYINFLLIQGYSLSMSHTGHIDPATKNFVPNYIKVSVSLRNAAMWLDSDVTRMADFSSADNNISSDKTSQINIGITKDPTTNEVVKTEYEITRMDKSEYGVKVGGE